MNKPVHVHTFYTVENDFTQEEIDRKNLIYLHILAGDKICKWCGFD